MEGKSHLSLIFLLVINIVIQTSQSDGEWLENDNNDEGNEESNVEFSKFINDEEEEATENDGMLTPNVVAPYNRFKVRRNAPFDNDESERDLPFGKADVRYILDHMQTRDVNGQTATAKPASDTFNGKLIRCFIHRCLRSFSEFSHIESEIYCFVFLCLLFSSSATIHSSYRSSQQQQQSWQWFIEDVHK